MPIFFLLLMVSSVFAAKGGGYDAWGYNYGSNSFSGFMCKAFRGSCPDWCDYPGPKFSMRWNDAYMDSSGARHNGFPSFIGSGAWFSNSMRLSMLDNGARGSYGVKVAALDYAGQPCSKPYGPDFCIVSEDWSGDGPLFWHGPIMPLPP